MEYKIKALNVSSINGYIDKDEVWNQKTYKEEK